VETTTPAPPDTPVDGLQSVMRIGTEVIITAAIAIQLLRGLLAYRRRFRRKVAAYWDRFESAEDARLIRSELQMLERLRKR
jgi:hypothetical protein